MYMPPTLEEILTLGKLLASYRTMRGVTQDSIARPQRSDESRSYIQYRVSRIENDLAPQPSIPLLYQFASSLRLSQLQYSQLLRAAGHAPSTQEIAEAGAHLDTHLRRFSMPAYLMDSRGYVWIWNAPFAHAYGASSAQSNTANAPLPLTPGTHILMLLIHPASGLRQSFEPEAWYSVVRTQLIRFWQTSRRLIQPAWGGEPEWLQQLVARLVALPAPAGQQFEQLWSQVQQMPTPTQEELLPQSLSDTLPPASLPLDKPLADTIMLRDGHSRIMLMATHLLPDSRLSVALHIPQDAATLPSSASASTPWPSGLLP